RNTLGKRENHLFAGAARNRGEQFQDALDLLRRRGGKLPDANLFVRSRAGLLVVAGEFLVEFLTRADARDLDLDVFVELQAALADHLLPQIEDLDRPTHAQHKDPPSLPDGAGLHDQLGGFGDGHEIAFHVRMSDRDRPAGFDLLAEDGDDAAGGTQDIAEAY